MKKLLYFLLIALFCGAFASCSKDDNEGGNNSSYKKLIVGTWKWVKEAHRGSVKIVDYDCRNVLKSNGTGYTLIDGYHDDDFEWEIDGNYLYYYFRDGGTATSLIEKLTEKELVTYIWDEYEGLTWTEYFEKVD